MNARDLGALIRKKRKDKNLTQKQLGELLHVTLATVSKWETGINFPDIENLKVLSEMLDIPISQIFDNSPDKSDPAVPAPPGIPSRPETTTPKLPVTPEAPKEPAPEVPEEPTPEIPEEPHPCLLQIFEDNRRNGRRLSKQMSMQKKVFTLTAFLILIVLCGTIFFTAMNKYANTAHEEPDFENVCIKESVEFGNQLSHLDKVDDALVFIEPLNNEINRVYINVQVKDDINNSDIDNISNYIENYFEELNKEQLIISYIDSSYNIRHLEPESSY